MNTSKRPSPSKPFNSSTTHPASISASTTSNQTQKREHVTSSTSTSTSNSGSKNSKGVEELAQSGGGAGGGVGAGSKEVLEQGQGEEILEGIAKGERNRGNKIDVRKIHPASLSSSPSQKVEGGGGMEKRKKRESKL